jgi:trans-aconitate 2-methyltransferase
MRDVMWDPAQYLRFGDERSRAFFELTSQIRTERPGLVVDLGCGPGQLTAYLASRWPEAEVRGIDSSAEMIAAAQQAAAGDGRVQFSLGDLRDWQPERPVDVIVSNAVLQWVPEHEELLQRWAAALSPGGWLAFQLPGNSAKPVYAILRELAESDRWRPLLSGASLNQQSASPVAYLDLLSSAGCVVNAWETTYQHVLPGEDPVLEWYRGAGLRPLLATLDPDQAAVFAAEYGARLREAYPRRPYGTILPFRRVFVVAHRSS